MSLCLRFFNHPQNFLAIPLNQALLLLDDETFRCTSMKKNLKTSWNLAKKGECPSPSSFVPQKIFIHRKIIPPPWYQKNPLFIPRVFPSDEIKEKKRAEERGPYTHTHTRTHSRGPKRGQKACAARGIHRGKSTNLSFLPHRNDHVARYMRSPRGNSNNET